MCYEAFRGILTPCETPGLTMLRKLLTGKLLTIYAKNFIVGNWEGPT